MLRALAFEGSAWKEIGELDRISDIVSENGHLVWAVADASSLTPADVEVISSELSLHPLAVEDALAPRQRPKFETYEDHLFAIAHELLDDGTAIRPKQLASFIGSRWVFDHSQRCQYRSHC
jgi:magnesium transporter